MSNQIFGGVQQLTRKEREQMA